MYVCVCNALNDRQVRQALCDGACKASEIYRHFGVRPQCGRCVPAMQQMVRDGERKVSGS